MYNSAKQTGGIMELAAILNKAQSELDQIAEKIDALTKRREQLQIFLATCRSLAADVQQGGPIVVPPPDAKAMEEPRTAKSIILEAVTTILRRGQPKTTKQLVQELDALGVQIGGSDKVSNLAAMLSREKHLFHNVRGLGYSLVESHPGKIEATGVSAPVASGVA